MTAFEPLSRQAHTVDEQWIRWWCAPWSWAHHGWQLAFASNIGLPPDACEDLLRSHPGEFLRSAGIAAAQPPQPDLRLMQWLMLSTRQQAQALELAARICFGRGNDTHVQSSEHDAGAHEIWCRSLAKALRPGHWLDPRVKDARQLLGAWTDPECWPRMRLFWKPGELPDTLAVMPDNKLQTLWQAVIWRITTP